MEVQQSEISKQILFIIQFSGHINIILPETQLYWIYIYMNKRPKGLNGHLSMMYFVLLQGPT